MFTTQREEMLGLFGLLDMKLDGRRRQMAEGESSTEIYFYVISFKISKITFGMYMNVDIQKYKYRFQYL